MPLEKNNLINADSGDPETLLENDKSKDLKLVDDNHAPDSEQLNCRRDMRMVSDGEALDDGIIEIADKKNTIRAD